MYKLASKPQPHWKVIMWLFWCCLMVFWWGWSMRHEFIHFRFLLVLISLTFPCFYRIFIITCDRRTGIATFWVTGDKCAVFGKSCVFNWDGLETFECDVSKNRTPSDTGWLVNHSNSHVNTRRCEQRILVSWFNVVASFSLCSMKIMSDLLHDCRVKVQCLRDHSGVFVSL